jgi:hypothetical protein
MLARILHQGELISPKADTLFEVDDDAELEKQVRLGGCYYRRPARRKDPVEKSLAVKPAEKS